MAAMKSAVIFNFRAALLIVVITLMVQSQMMGAEAQAQAQTCSASLGNVNVCAPFVVPGAPNTNPSPDCCGALQSIDHDCLCNTLRIAARLPAQCNLPPLNCAA